MTDENGLPIIGVTIITASKNGTTTDMDGNYTLEATEGELITFSYIGYSKQSVEAKSLLNIQLKPTSIGLDEVTVVAIGYGVSRKADLTGAITSVSAKDFKQGVISSAEQLLQGKVAGLIVSQGGGDPTKVLPCVYAEVPLCLPVMRRWLWLMVFQELTSVRFNPMKSCLWMY